MEVVQSVQLELYNFEGTLCRFIVDDKGTGILAAFGLPPYAQHENDAVRGCKLAKNVVKNIQSKWGHKVSVGVTCGRVYAGVVGGHTRCEYTLHGSVVNLAARLMVAASKSGDEVLVNDVAFRGANNEIEFDEPKRIRCKGYDYPIPVYRPTGVRDVPLEENDDQTDIQLICDGNNLAAMQAALTQAAQQEQGGVICVEGEAGMGKSRYCRYIAKNASDQGFNVIRCTCHDSAKPYYIWRQLLSSILKLNRYRNAKSEIIWEHLLQAVPESQREIAPLLRDVFPGVHEDNKRTAALVGTVRSDELCIVRGTDDVARRRLRDDPPELRPGRQ